MYSGWLEVLWSFLCPEQGNCLRSESCPSLAGFYCTSTGSHDIDLVIPVAPEDIPKTAKATLFGLFEFLRMPFGLRNAARTFQHFMNKVLQGLNFSYAYIDDVLIASSSPEEHLEHLQLVFQRLKNNGIVLFSKAVLVFRSLIFWATMVTLLSFANCRTMFKLFKIFNFLTHILICKDLWSRKLLSQVHSRWCCYLTATTLPLQMHKMPIWHATVD